jgi:phosphoglycolate phosphatase-like HAD superfamily hydrolase
MSYVSISSQRWFTGETGMKAINLSKYNRFFFDFDGVIANTNELKLSSFLEIAALHAPALFEQFARFNLDNAGANRVTKVEYLLQLMGRSDDESLKMEMLDYLASQIREKLLSASLLPGVKDFLNLLNKRGKECYIVSAGSYNEIELVLKKHSISHHFKEISCFPASKDVFIQRVLESPGGAAILFGDSIHDHKAAKVVRIDFCFVSECALGSSREVLEGSSQFSIINFLELSRESG